MEYTKEIETPLGKHKVVIKTMLTGAEREQVEGAPNKFIKTDEGKDMHVTDLTAINTAEKHELLKVAVLTIDGDLTDCFKRLQSMYEPDYAFVYNELLAAQKKMMDSTSAAS